MESATAENSQSFDTKGREKMGKWLEGDVGSRRFLLLKL